MPTEKVPIFYTVYFKMVLFHILRFVLSALNVPSFIYEYGQLSLNGHLYKTHTSVKWTPTVGLCLSFLPLFDSLQDRHPSEYFPLS